ncbi:MAG: hypothetical protein J0L88_08790 [Xanthomonadales bacterium]|nr:hypothetical protein [Xanthomonadales bacterium]
MPFDTDALRRRELLSHLPQFDPDPGLWARIDAAHQRQMRERRAAWRWLSAGLAAALVAVVVLPRGTGQRNDEDLASWQRRSQALEREWLARAHAAGDTRLHARLLGIDDRLQAAYDRGAGDAELAPLWKQRIEALDDLIARDDSPMRVVTRL